MKKNLLSKYIIVLLSCVLAMVSSISAFAAVDKDSKWGYKVISSSSNITLNDYYGGGSEKDVIVPKAIDGYTVTSVALNGRAFASDEIESVTFPEGVTHVNYSFSYVPHLKTVYFPSTLEKVGMDGYDGCIIHDGCRSFESVIIPRKSIENIEYLVSNEIGAFTIYALPGGNIEEYAAKYSHITFKNYNECFSLSADKTNVLPADTIEFQANVVHAPDTYSYKYIVKNESKNSWSVLQDYSANSTYKWKAPASGKYTIYVDMKDPYGEVTRVEKTVTVGEGLKISAKSSLAQVVKGDKITLSATANGGIGSYTYSYLVHNLDSNTWARLTPSFVKNNTYTWTAGSTGNREFFVEVKDSTGKVVRSNAVKVKTTDKSIPQLPSLQAYAGASSAQVSVGTKVYLFGAGTGGEGTYTYSYLVHNLDTNKWSRLTPSFINSNMYTWTAGSTGNREFFVEVKDSTGKIVRSNAVTVKVK